MRVCSRSRPVPLINIINSLITINNIHSFTTEVPVITIVPTTQLKERNIITTTNNVILNPLTSTPTKMRMLFTSTSGLVTTVKWWQ